MTTKEKELKMNLLKRGIEASCKLLIGLMIELEVPNYVEGTIKDAKTNQKYKLRIEKL
jgi:hypothetical protein